MKKVWATASYAMMQAAMFGFFSTLLGYAGNILRAYSFADSQISLVLGLCMGLSCLCQMLLGELISRFRPFTTFRALLGAGGLMALSAVLFLAFREKIPSVLAMALGCVDVQIIPALVNSAGMDAIEQGSPASFSTAKGVGSVFFGLMAFLTGALVEARGIRVVGVLLLCLCAVFLTGILWFHRAGEVQAPGEKTGRTRPRRGFFREHPRYLLFLLGVVLVLCSHSLVCDFMMQIITSKGGNAAQQGIATSIAALAELPVTFAFPWLLKKMKCENWMRLSVIFFVLKALGLYAAQSCAGVYLAQTAQLLGYGVFSIAIVHYGAIAAGKGDAVRAQSYLSSANTLAILLSLSTGGVLCQYLGVGTMLLTAAALALLGAVVIYIVVGRKEGACEKVS